MTKFDLPERFEPFIDKYFLRTGEVLRKEGINPWVRAQVMIRKPGRVAGIDEALAILEKYSPLAKHGGRVYALREGSEYAPRETVMLIEAPIQDIVELETMYLGVLAAETTRASTGREVDLDKARETMRAVVKASSGRPVSYFGARHWRYDEDASITRAAFEAGATSASTDIGAQVAGQKGMGTTPHVLENIMAYVYGYEEAVPRTMEAFDRHIDEKVPRIILCDYRNREITDSLETARRLEGRLAGVRLDTCGENVGEGALEFPDSEKLTRLVGRQVEVPAQDQRYWFGRGVTITGAYALRKALNQNGYANVKIMLSSGFADPEKVRAFVRAEEILGTRLFDGLGVGQIFESYASKMDIVAVGDSPETLIPISKTGRQYNPNPRLELRLGGRVTSSSQLNDSEMKSGGKVK